MIKCIDSFAACEKMLANCRIRGLRIIGACLKSNWHVLAKPCGKSLGTLAYIPVSRPALELISYSGC